jgi:phosphoglycerate kinase
MNPSNTRPFHTIDEVSALRGKRVIVRASLNVPLDGGMVRDNFRIKEACETILYLQEQGARVVVLAHIGRAENETLKPVYDAMQTFLPALWAGGLIGAEVTSAISHLKDGEIMLLENVRSDSREVSNDDAFARELAAHGTIYINDAFADSHREHASIVGIPTHLPSYAGFLFTREYDALSKAFDPALPALFILGGAKFETKLPLVERFIEKYNHVFIGGAIANDFLKGKGYEVGKSKVSDVDLSSSPLLNDPRIIIPDDVIVSGLHGRVVKAADAVMKDESILDIGPGTIQKLAPIISGAQTILWNGPPGAYEDGYTDATNALAKMIADAKGESIIGGGDTIAAIKALGLNEKFDFISTAGGAMLQFLENETLPGIEALRAAVVKLNKALFSVS